MDYTSDEAQLKALDEIRQREAKRLNILPQEVITDAVLGEIVSLKPTNNEQLLSTPSLSVLLSAGLGEAIFRVFASPPPQSQPKAHPPPSTTTPIPKQQTSPAFLPLSRKRGGKLAMEVDDERVAPPPPRVEPILSTSSSTSSSLTKTDSFNSSNYRGGRLAREENVDENTILDAAPLESRDVALYEAYQRDMKSVQSARDASEEVESAQKRLLNIFCSGYPVQLSRLDITSAKVVYTAIPTILQLRQGKPGGSLKLEIEDLNSSSLTDSIRQLYPDISELQVKLALCEWYHDLHPELQLNSARFSAPKTRTKRKAPTASTVSDTDPKPMVTEPPKAKESSRIPDIGFPMNPVRKSPRMPKKAYMLVSGFDRTVRQQLEMSSSDEEIIDQDPSEDYSEKPEKKTFRGGADSWRSSGPRPKKFPKRTSMDSIGFVSFQSNTNKERAELTDDDFAGNDDAYFADAYSPSVQKKKVPQHQLESNNGKNTPTTSDRRERDLVEEEVPLSPPLPPVMASLSEVSVPEMQKRVSGEDGKDKGRPNFGHYDDMEPKQILERFNRIRLSATTNGSQTPTSNSSV